VDADEVLRLLDGGTPKAPAPAPAKAAPKSAAYVPSSVAVTESAQQQETRKRRSTPLVRPGTLSTGGGGSAGGAGGPAAAPASGGGFGGVGGGVSPGGVRGVGSGVSRDAVAARAKTPDSPPLSLEERLARRMGNAVSPLPGAQNMQQMRSPGIVSPKENVERGPSVSSSPRVRSFGIRIDTSSPRARRLSPAGGDDLLGGDDSIERVRTKPWNANPKLEQAGNHREGKNKI
jgi:hypothetical protein